MKDFLEVCAYGLMAAGVVVALLTISAWARRTYHRWRIRRLNTRHNQLQARIAAENLATCQAIWNATATIPTQRRKEDQ